MWPIQQTVAPADCSAQRPVARRHVYRAPREQVEAGSTQTFQHDARRQHVDLGGAELNRERQSVEPNADFRNDARVFGGDRKVRPERSGALDEECDRRRPSEHVQRRQVLKVRHG
jgi:hypothetical protein